MENLKEDKTGSVRKGNTGARSRNYCGRGRTISNTYSEFIFVVLVM
jgi:hypothetical protein